MWFLYLVVEVECSLYNSYNTDEWFDKIVTGKMDIILSMLNSQKNTKMFVVNKANTT